MTSERWTLEEVCEKKSSNLMQKDLNLGTGEFPIYGASGLLGYVDFYQRDKEYIGIVKDGAGVGRAMLLPAKSSCIGTMQYLVPKDCISSHYLYYAVESMNLAKYNTGATIPHIYFRDYKKETLPKKGRDEQEYIASNLDKVVETIRKRRLQLQFFDDLVKSQFIGMFGDPITNAKLWPTDTVERVCERIYGGGTPSKSRPEFYDGQIPWVTPKDMKTTTIVDSVDHITEDAIKCSATNIVPKGAVLMVIRSGILKHTLPVALSGNIVTINQDMKAFVVRKEIINAAFLLHYFQAIEKDVLSEVRGVTADNIDFKAFVKRKVILPPIDLQNQFAAFVEQIDKSKVLFTQKLFFQLYMAICVKAFEKNAQMLYNCRREVAR